MSKKIHIPDDILDIADRMEHSAYGTWEKVGIYLNVSAPTAKSKVLEHRNKKLSAENERLKEQLNRRENHDEKVVLFSKEA